MAHDPTRSLSIPEREAGDWHAAPAASDTHPTASEVAQELADEAAAVREEAFEKDDARVDARDEAVQVELDRAEENIEKSAHALLDLPADAAPPDEDDDVSLEQRIADALSLEAEAPAPDAQPYNVDPSAPEAQTDEPDDEAILAAESEAFDAENPPEPKLDADPS